MKKSIGYFSILFLFISSSLLAQTQLTQTIYFDFDDDTVTDEAKSELLKFKEELADYTESHLHIIGHADQDGSDEYNMKLSQERAKSVELFIANNQFSNSRLIVDYLGESDLVFRTSDAASKKNNRRVTVVAEVYNYTTAEEMVTQLLPNNKQEKTINPEIKSEIKLTKGTVVKIPANAFCYADGSPLASNIVDIVFKEAFDYTTMVDERLFTQTEDQILETGGMILIEASQNGREVKLLEGKEIELLFPEQEYKDEMEVFTGTEDENGIIWDATGDEVTSVEDEYFVQIDMNSLFDYNFEGKATPVIDLTEMPKYPYSKRIAYPPLRSKYTEEKYQEVYKKYEDVMAAHYKYEEGRPERIKEWHEEVSRRLVIMHEHKRAYLKSKFIGEVEKAVLRMKGKEFSVSNEKLTGSLLGFLEKEIETVKYDDAYFCRKIFKGAVKDVNENRNFPFLEYGRMSISAFLPDLYPLIRALHQNAMDEKYQMGYVDEKMFASYVVKTSNLGWINCDRFIQLAKEDKMNLEIAEFSADQQYYLVFKNMKSLIRPNFIKDKVVFANVPKGEDVRIVGVGFQNNMPYMATQDITLGSGEALNLRYEKAGISELRKVLEM